MLFKWVKLPFGCVVPAGFPLGLEKWEGIFQSGNFEQTGKVRENHTKYWKTQGIRDKYYLIFLYMSYFAYACKTERQNGISRLISKLLRTLNSSLRDHLFMLQNEVF